jgi:hypothetical protein
MFVVQVHQWMLQKIMSIKELFGEQASQILSVYEHKHDHVHSDEGG